MKKNIFTKFLLLGTCVLFSSCLLVCAQEATEQTKFVYTYDREKLIEQAMLTAQEQVHIAEDGGITVEHAYGQTVMPEEYDRIVVLKLEDLALSLDVDMVACRTFEGWYLEDDVKTLQIGEIAIDEAANTINMEQVLSYSPDLIILRDSFDQSVYDQLSNIAPTIAFHLQDPYGSLVALGRALGREEQAIERLNAYCDLVDVANEKMANITGPVAMIRILKKEVRLYPATTSNLSSYLYNQLHLTPDPMVVAYDEMDNQAISLEMLSDLTAEHLLVVAGYGSQGAEDDQAAKELYESYKSDPLWATIPAVAAGNLYEMDSRLFLQHGVIANERKIQEVYAALTGETLEEM